MGTNSEAELNRKFMEFAKLMNIYLNHFPKHEKYALASRIELVMYPTYTTKYAFAISGCTQIRAWCLRKVFYYDIR